MFNFYKLFYPIYLSKQEIQEACKWKVINEEEYKTIVGEEYTSQ
ncbi:XkdX family protein [Clostridium scatologenes]|uniref:XkdX family protein n=1 Tax=Clostridium scatologenes TaxID=1548 RepID=A0A0E3M9S9_CLOSL|nr:XkdX family protein [Clostridium scatologenes]AKA69825.1 hypothetical protein CSCA_2700 [Clostridium scatologenes]